jgi:hypothetical protein
MKSFLDRIVATLVEMAENSNIPPHLRIRSADSARQAIKLKPRPVKRKSPVVRRPLTITINKNDDQN